MAGIAQRRHYLVLRAQLGSAFLGALLASASAVVTAEELRQWLLQASAVALLIAFVVTLVGRILRSDTLWWDARAVAESLRSSTWRYMMQAPPFDGNHDGLLDQRFLAGVAETLQARRAILPALERERDNALDEITPTMRSNRNALLDERKAIYGVQRLDEQRRWYGGKARYHDRSRETYFVLGTVTQLAAVIVAFLQWRPLKFNLVPLLVALSASLTAWSQAKRHEESAQAYALARQELDLMAGRIAATTGEDDFRLAVAEAEAAISREHTMWMARRNR